MRSGFRVLIMTEVEFKLNGLEYSAVLPYSYTWAELEERGFSFSDGWRVPYRHELIKLFDSVEASRDDAYLWSASVNANYSDYAWYVDFNNGGSYYNNRTEFHGLRLVRELKSGN